MDAGASGITLILDDVIDNWPLETATNDVLAADVNRPCWSTVMTGIWVEPPYVPGVTAVDASFAAVTFAFKILAVVTASAASFAAETEPSVISFEAIEIVIR